VFNSWHYQRHTQRRQEHLASLGLHLAGRSVLEVGAGIGDHTSFFLDRGCLVLVTEARPENLKVVRERYPDLDVRRLDLDDPPSEFAPTVEVVYCYGTLYHLARPAEALAFLAERTSDLLLLETCVSLGDALELNRVREKKRDFSQALEGTGCRPTRPWVWAELEKHFPFVYVTVTQPWHEEFPLDWRAAVGDDGLTRSVFVAAKRELALSTLSPRLLDQQTRH
jgi:SAM-dependent methyltransferase